MNKLICLMLIALAPVIASGRVLAAGAGHDGLDCASATELASGTTYTGNTLYANDVVHVIGGIPSPAKDHIYVFTAADVNGPISIDWASYDFAVFVTSACSPATPAPLAAAVGPAPVQLDLSTLIPGQRYYLIVTGNPYAGSGIEGAYSLTTAWLGPDGNGDGGLNCASATELASGTTYTGNTLYANDVINIIGAIPSPARDHIYAFTAGDVNGPISIDWASYDFAAFVTPACLSATPAPVAAAAGPAPVQLDLSTLIPGRRYYLILTGNPNAVTGIEGAYSLTTAWLGPDGNGDGGLDCASATELLPDRVYSGNTLFGGNPIGNIGPIPSPANDHIYTFTAADGLGSLAVKWADYHFVAFLTDACSASAPLARAVAEGPAPAHLDLSGLVAGARYYVIVSGITTPEQHDEGAYILAMPWWEPGLPDAIFSASFD